MAIDRTHKKLPAPYLEGVGAVTVAWSHMESNLGNVIMNLGAINAHVCQALTIDVGSQNLLNVIQITVNAFCQKSDLVIRWNKLVGEIQEVRGERNRIVHGQWMWGFEYPDKYFVAVCDFSARGTQITASSLTRTPESLHEVANVIFRLIDEMQALVAETIPALAAPLSTAPRQIQIVMAAPDKRMKKAAAQQKVNDPKSTQ